MGQTTHEDDNESTGERFLEAVRAISNADHTLTTTEAALLTALHLDIAQDSRTFARMLDLAHALVLRDVSNLSDDRHLLSVLSRNPRTQRTELALTPQAELFLTRALPPEHTASA